MSLMTYPEVRPWAKSIQKAVASRTMPPFHAGGPVGRFENDLRLSIEEIKTIEQWVMNGAPLGNSEEDVQNSNQAKPPSPKNKWDLEIEFEEIDLRPDGTDQHIVVYSDYTFQEDTWVQAVQYCASNRQNVHHAGVFAVPETVLEPGIRSEAVTTGSNLRLAAGKALQVWLPGQTALRYPKGQGVRIKKGDRIALQIHFSPSNERIVEQSTVGLDFVDGILKYQTRIRVHQFRELRIPPGDSHYELRYRAILRNNDLTAQAFGCHMHLRGKSCKVKLYYPDGRAETVFEIPEYNFDWQRWYTLVDPITIPKNTTIEYVLAWDNSKQNQLNPDPSREVRWGPNTTDEMGSVRIRWRAELNPPLRLNNGVALDVSTGP